MLTIRQKQVLDFVKSYQKGKGYAPVLEEIRKKLKLASVSTAHFHVSRLRDLGYLEKQKNRPRAIAVVGRETMLSVPLLGTIAAGQPIEAVLEKETIAVPKSKLPSSLEVYALRVEGDSMIDENINDNDVVLIKSQNVAENGQKVVALINNSEATLKKFYREKGRIRLEPANPKYESIYVNPNDLLIQGVLVDIIRSGLNKKKIFNEKNVDTRGEYKYELSPKNKIICGDCVDELKKLPENSIDGCITDPPYNYEFIGHKWDSDEIKRRIERVKNSKTLVKHIPYGSGLAGGVRNKRWYQKNAQNINEYSNWCQKWGAEIFRVLKPGGYILIFNSSRTIAHVQIAMEKVGFYARDIIVWRKNSGIPKGLNFEKKLKKQGIDDHEKWRGWHSCLRNEWEAIVILQKPLINNYLETIKEFGVGLMNTQRIDGAFQSNILEGIRHDKKEDFNLHCTTKPIPLISRLIELVLPLEKSKIVLDPFMGSGTTAIAALDKNVSYLGIEINEEYCKIAQKRIELHTAKKEQELF